MRCPLILPCLAVLLAAAGCHHHDSAAPAPPASQAAQPAPKDAHPMSQMTISSPAFADGQTIPVQYTGDGQNISPPLEWSNPPAGCLSAAMIVDDPDAPRPQPWVHWVIYNLPPQGSLGPNVGQAQRPSQPAGAVQGFNTAGQTGYMGPSPPKGHGVHHYHFKLYALDRPLDPRPGMTKEQLLSAMQGHILAQAELAGTYERR